MKRPAGQAGSEAAHGAHESLAGGHGESADCVSAEGAQVALGRIGGGSGGSGDGGGTWAGATAEATAGATSRTSGGANAGVNAGANTGTSRSMGWDAWRHRAPAAHPDEAGAEAALAAVVDQLCAAAVQQRTAAISIPRAQDHVGREHGRWRLWKDCWRLMRSCRPTASGGADQPASAKNWRRRWRQRWFRWWPRLALLAALTLATMPAWRSIRLMAIDGGALQIFCIGRSDQAARYGRESRQGTMQQSPQGTVQGTRQASGQETGQGTLQ